MNEIISALERLQGEAYSQLLQIRGSPISTDTLDLRAVLQMAYDHLLDTVIIFKHARKLKNELEVIRKPETYEGEDPPT